MKIVNIMNFVRQIDERSENSTEKLLSLTKYELALVNEYGINNTFLLQYDALCDADFTDLFKREATEKTELGLWYEIVEPLTSACGMEYRSEKGWKWDWHIIPGFSMAYTPAQRELLIDEAMRKFKDVFGYYPKTVASWLIDTHTVNYLTKKYDISSLAICRDQDNTDAYTLIGGYFNQAYYPSANNVFTPAQSKEMQVNTPVFRLLGPCPIHNYDKDKYCSDEYSAKNKSGCYTMEPCWQMGSHEDSVGWMLDCYYGEESLGFAYMQTGQENSFFGCGERVLKSLQMQIEMLIARGDVEFTTMGQAGEIFKSLYPNTTPATCVVAKNNFDSEDVQSVYYDCKNYTANLFRYENKLFLRSLFLFDEQKKDLYIETPCTTFDAVYENLPIVDTRKCPKESRKHCGLMIDESAVTFHAKKIGEGVLAVDIGERSVVFYEDAIEIASDRLVFYTDNIPADVTSDEQGVVFNYKGTAYRLLVKGASVIPKNDCIEFIKTEKVITLIPTKTV